VIVTNTLYHADMESDVRTVIDELIAERASWYYKNGVPQLVLRACLNGLLGYRHTVELANSLVNLSAERIFTDVGQQLAKNVRVSGIQNIPSHGPVLIVCNHPTGIADGLILHNALLARRDDIYFFANRDITRVFPQMESMIAPVEWRPEKRRHTDMRHLMQYVRDATANGRIGIIFPSGRLAKRVGLNLVERPWMASAAMIARKFELPVVPVHISARNSLLFYLFDLIHPTLRDITLFHETLNKGGFPFDVRIGEAVGWAELNSNSGVAIKQLKERTLRLGRATNGFGRQSKAGEIWIPNPRQV
jgi:putative hemolysin